MHACFRDLYPQAIGQHCVTRVLFFRNHSMLPALSATPYCSRHYQMHESQGQYGN
jgi:hypothetical protein